MTEPRPQPKAPKLAQGSSAWQEWRRGGYGASDAPVLAEGDEHAWQVLHAIKLGLLDDPDANEPMEWGLALEDVIAKRYAEHRLGEPVVRRQLLVQHPELPYVRASLDRRTRRGRKIVEIKAWSFRTDDFGPDGSDQVPLRMAYQVQQQMAASGYEDADLAVFFGASKRLGIFKLHADRTLIDELLGLEGAAWGYIERGVMPPWPGPVAARVPLLADEVEPSEELVAMVGAHELLREASELAEEQYQSVRKALRSLLQEYGGTRGQLPDGRRFQVRHRYNKDSQLIGWQEVAAGYRKLLEAKGVSPAELDFPVTALTTTRPGARPLVITISQPKEKHDDASPSPATEPASSPA